MEWRAPAIVLRHAKSLKHPKGFFFSSQLIRKMVNLQSEKFKPSNFELRPLQHSKIYNRPKAGCIHMREPHRLLLGEVVGEQMPSLTGVQPSMASDWTQNTRSLPKRETSERR